MATYAYDAWGNMTYCNAGTDVALINPFFYRGHYFDSESGLYYLQGRYYDPSVGQFISPDTMQALQPNVIGGVNLYSYSNNNPIVFESREMTIPIGQTIDFSNLFLENLTYNHWNPHWKNEWFMADGLSSLIFFKTKGKLVDWGLSIYKGALYFDEAEFHSLYIGIGNASAFAGYDSKKEKLAYLQMYICLILGMTGDI